MYQVGGSLQNDAPSYIERLADSELYEGLKRGEFCYVLNARQMGKSSLHVRARTKLQSEGFVCTTIDLTAIGNYDLSAEQWYACLIYQLANDLMLKESFNFKTWWQTVDFLPPVQRLFKFVSEILLERVSDRIAIFIDEIDSVISLDFSVDDFFALIRFFFNQRAIDPKYNRISFAIFGVASPGDLIQDKTRTPFNIGKPIELQGFTLEEAEPLARGLNLNEASARRVLEEIIAWTNGQPFLTQKLCQLVVDECEHSGQDKPFVLPGEEKSEIEYIIRNKLIGQWMFEDKPEHLRTIVNRILSQEQRAGKLLEIYQSVLQRDNLRSDESREQVELLLSGLVLKQNGYLRIKNRIYAEIFNRNWVEKQLNLLRPYSQALKEWVESQQTDESRLLRGKALKEARHWIQGKELSDLDYHFLAASVEFEQREMRKAWKAERTKAIAMQLKQEQKKLAQERKIARLQKLYLISMGIALAIVSGLGIMTFWLFRQAVNSQIQAKLNEIKAMGKSSEALFVSQENLEALVQAMDAERERKKLVDANERVKQTVESELEQAVYGMTEYNRFSGHDSKVRGIAIARDGKFIASASDDKTIKLWQRDGTLLKTFSGHENKVNSVDFSPDGKTIISAAADNTVKIWKRNGNLIGTLQGHEDRVKKAMFSPDGKTIISAAADGKVKLWQSNGTPIATIEAHQGEIFDIDISPDGHSIASAAADGTVKLWHGNRLEISIEQKSRVYGVAFSPDGNSIATACGDNTVKLWSRDGTLIRTFKGHEKEVWTVSFSPDGRSIASGATDNTIKVWRISDGVLLNTLTGHKDFVSNIAFSPQREHTVLISASWDRTVRFWKIDNAFLTKLSGHTAGVSQVAFNSNSTIVASASDDNTVKLWKLDGTLLQTLKHDSRVYGIEISPDDKIIATASADKTVRLWQLGDLSAKALVLEGHKDEIWMVAVSPDSETIASASEDNTVRLWKRDGKSIVTLRGHRGGVFDVDISPDNQTIASASADGTAKLWNRDGTLAMTLNKHQGGVYGVAFSPDGQTIATTSADKTIKLWQRDGTLIRTLEGHHDVVWKVAFNPQGNQIASVSDDKTIKIWKIDGTLINTLKTHISGVWGVKFSPDGKLIASASADTRVILWNLPQILTLDELQYACQWVKDYLHNNEQIEKEDKFLCENVIEQKQLSTSSIAW